MASKMRIPGGTLAELLRFVIYESRDSIIRQHFSIVQERESYYTKDVLYLSADFTNELGRCLEGPSGGYEVIDQQHICTCLYILCMYLDNILTVFKGKPLFIRLTRKFTGLSHQDLWNLQPVGKGGGKEKTPGFNRSYRIDFYIFILLYHCIYTVFKSRGGLKDSGNIIKEDSRFRKIRYFANCLIQVIRCNHALLHSIIVSFKPYTIHSN